MTNCFTSCESLFRYIQKTLSSHCKTKIFCRINRKKKRIMKVNKQNPQKKIKTEEWNELFALSTQLNYSPSSELESAPS